MLMADVRLLSPLLFVPRARKNLPGHVLPSRVQGHLHSRLPTDGVAGILALPLFHLGHESREVFLDVLNGGKLFALLLQIIFAPCIGVVDQSFLLQSHALVLRVLGVRNLELIRLIELAVLNLEDIAGVEVTGKKLSHTGYVLACDASVPVHLQLAIPDHHHQGSKLGAKHVLELFCHLAGRLCPRAVELSQNRFTRGEHLQVGHSARMKAGGHRKKLIHFSIVQLLLPRFDIDAEACRPTMSQLVVHVDVVKALLPFGSFHILHDVVAHLQHPEDRSRTVKFRDVMQRTVSTWFGPNGHPDVHHPGSGKRHLDLGNNVGGEKEDQVSSFQLAVSPRRVIPVDAS